MLNLIKNCAEPVSDSTQFHLSLTYEKATPTILSLYYVFIKKRKKNPEYYPGIFSYYII